MTTLIDDLTQSHLLPDKVYERALQLIADEIFSGLADNNPRRAIEKTLELLEECLFLNMGRVLLPDHSGKYLRIRYSHGLPLEKRFITYDINEGISGFVFTTGQAIYIDDLDTNSMYKGQLVQPIDLPYSKPAFSGVPLRSVDNRTIGVLCVNHGYRNPEEVKLTLDILEKTALMISQLIAFD